MVVVPFSSVFLRRTASSSTSKKKKTSSLEIAGFTYKTVDGEIITEKGRKSKKLGVDEGGFSRIRKAEVASYNYFPCMVENHMFIIL